MSAVDNSKRQTFQGPAITSESFIMQIEVPAGSANGVDLLDTIKSQLASNGITQTRAPEVLQLLGITDTAKTDVWKAVVGGLTDAGDIARVTVNGDNFDAYVTAGLTTDQVAELLLNAISLGSVEQWNVVPGGVADGGDTFRTTINAVNYDFVAIGGETVAQLCAGITASLALCPEYTASNESTYVKLVATAPGVSPDVTVSLPVDLNGDATYSASQVIAGITASTDCTAVRSNSELTITSTVAGTLGVLAVTSGYVVDPDADGTIVSTHTVVGDDAHTSTTLEVRMLKDVAGFSIPFKQTSANNPSPLTLNIGGKIKHSSSTSIFVCETVGSSDAILCVMGLY